MSVLMSQEIERYARHLVLPEIGGAGQQKLRAARVLVVGAGGLGSPVLEYCAAAGIGTLRIADDDAVDLSNLQRQVIHSSEAVGMPKAQSAAARIAALNPHVSVEARARRFDQRSAQSLLTGVDVAVDGSDNFETRTLLAESCAKLRIPLVTAAVGRFDGTVTTLTPWEGPSWADLFPQAPPDGVVPSCAEAGIVGALTGIIGTIQAMEVIKLIAGVGEPLVGRLLMVDALNMRFETVTYGERMNG
jgi:molybdopterin/thiamine biosynthesis adenylyltransferase